MQDKKQQLRSRRPPSGAWRGTVRPSASGHRSCPQWRGPSLGVGPAPPAARNTVGWPWERDGRRELRRQLWHAGCHSRSWTVRVDGGQVQHRNEGPILWQETGGIKSFTKRGDKERIWAQNCRNCNQPWGSSSWVPVGPLHVYHWPPGALPPAVQPSQASPNLHPASSSHMSHCHSTASVLWVVSPSNLELP